METCHSGCCTIYTRAYTGTLNYEKKYLRGGAFIFSPTEGRILLVQSKGMLWGCPKGSSNLHESVEDCAIREVFEETGIRLLPSEFDLAYNVRSNGRIVATYFYIETDGLDVNLDTSDSSISGITWIRLSCLRRLLKEGWPKLDQKKVKINHHTRLLCDFICEVQLPY